MTGALSYLLAPVGGALSAAAIVALGGAPRDAAAAGIITALTIAVAQAWTGLLRRRQVERWAEALTRAEGSPLISDPFDKNLPSLDGLLDLEPLHRAMVSFSQRLQDRVRSSSLDGRILNAVVDGMSQGTWITDAHGTIFRHNQALMRMLPPGAEPMGHRPLALLRSTALHEAVMRACAEGESAQLEIALDGPNARVLSVQVRPLGKDLPGSAAVFEDVTGLRRLEQVRKDFVANVSHELRTPIAAILGYAETLQAGALQDKDHAAAMVDIIHRQSVRMSELVQDLLELSKLEAKKVVMGKAPVSLREATSNAVETVRPKAHSKEISLEADVPENLRALGDARAIEQVMLNLLDNAVKYTGSGGRVSVTGYQDGDRCRLEIRDSGMGIERHHLPRIFERFYRIDKGRSRDMGGTGLGLAIVKHLVNAMGGDVQVDSQPGHGSTFTVSFESGGG